MLKNWLLIFMTASAAHLCRGQQQTFANTVFDFPEGKLVKVFADSTNVRDAPETNGLVVHSLRTNEEVYIIKKLVKVLQLGERAAHWFQVAFIKNGQQSTGYLWGGNLAIGHGKNSGYDFLFGIGKTDTRFSVETNEAYQVNTGVVKVLERNALIDQKYFDAGGPENLTACDFSVDETSKFKNVDLVIKAMATGAACAIPTYTQYYFFSKKKLIALPPLMSVADGDIYSHEEQYIFPEDNSGRIILQTTDYENDEDTGREKRAASRNIYSWDGIEFKKVK